MELPDTDRNAVTPKFPTLLIGPSQLTNCLLRAQRKESLETRGTETSLCLPRWALQAAGRDKH